MKDIKAKDIVRICKAEILCGDKEEILENFKKDTREIEKGDTYIGIKGERFNGSSFFESAFENGAKACILQDIEIDKKILDKYKDKIILKVKDTVEMLKEIAEYKRIFYNIPVIGITGSVGKTSTKDIISSVMSKRYNTQKTSGNYNNHIGVPLTILGLKEHEALVIEMGMNHFGELSKLTQIAKPNMAVITNIGTSHIGELGSRENILKAKLEILEGMNQNSPIIVNNDNDMLHDWYLKNKDNRNIMTFGMENESEIMAKNIYTNDKGSSFLVSVQGKEYQVEIKVGGKHFITNSLCAICVGLKNDIPMEKIIEGIKEFKLTKRRMEIKKGISNATVINDSYNASYDSVKAALEYLGELKGRKKIAVLGDMLELGEYAEELHSKVGKEVYKNKIDILITIGKLSKYIAKKAKELGMEEKDIYMYDTNDEAIEKLRKIIQEGDYILVKASKAMRFDEIVDNISMNTKFDA